MKSLQEVITFVHPLSHVVFGGMTGLIIRK